MQKDKIIMLVVDDDEANNTIITNMAKNYLQAIGFLEKSLIDSVYSGEDAITHAQKTYYDIIFMDVIMPGMDGFKAIEKVRELPIKQPIIIVITQLDDSESLRTGFFCGANWYITKPFDKTELEILLNDIIAGKLSNLKIEPKPSKKKSQKKKKASKNIKKISAKDFMKKSYLNKDDIHDIEELIEEYENILDVKNEQYFSLIGNIIEKFIDIFERHDDLKDVEYALLNLRSFLFSDPHETFNEEQIEMLKMFLESIMDDLDRWYRNVFLEQIETDINHLNASLLANMAKLEIVFKNQ